MALPVFFALALLGWLIAAKMMSRRTGATVSSGGAE